MFQILITILIVIGIVWYVTTHWNRWFGFEPTPLDSKKTILKQRSRETNDLAEEVDVTEKLTETTAKKNKSKKSLDKANTKLKQEETKDV